MSTLRESYAKVANPVKKPATRLLTDDGTREGSSDMAVDGSITPVDFWISPDLNSDFLIVNLSLSVSDQGSPGAEDYGNVAGPLTKGVNFFIERAGVRILDPVVLRSNTDILLIGSESSVTSLASNERVVTYKKLLGVFSDGVLLSHGTDDKFGITINDDLSGLSQHSMALEGSSIVAIV